MFFISEAQRLKAFIDQQNASRDTMAAVIMQGILSTKRKQKMTVKLPGRNSDFLKVAVAAAERGDLKSVKSVLKQRPHWHKHIGSHGRTMLWGASHKGKLEMVKYLVEQGSDVNACGSHYTPYFVDVSCLCIATYKKHEAVAKYLKSVGAKNNIHMAAFLGQLDDVKKFLKRSPKRLNMGHKQSAMADKNDDGLEFVFRKAPWATPLCYALRGGDVETATFLIEQGATIKGFEKQMFIAADDDYEMLRLLLENGADTEHAPTCNPDGSKLYKLLSSYGIEMSKDELNTEFVYLCRGDRGGNPDEVRAMLKHGANVDHQDHKGKTALHRAAKAGFIETMKILLKNKASVYLRDKDQETALFDASRSTIKNLDNQLAAIDLLIDFGAEIEIENRKGQSLISVVKKPEVAKRLKSRLKKKR